MGDTYKFRFREHGILALIVGSHELLLKEAYSIFTLVLIPKEYLGAASLTSLSAPSGLYAPGAGVTNCLGSLGLMWSEGATGSSLPKNLNKWIH